MLSKYFLKQLKTLIFWLQFLFDFHYLKFLHLNGLVGSLNIQIYINSFETFENFERFLTCVVLKIFCCSCCFRLENWISTPCLLICFEGIDFDRFEKHLAGFFTVRTWSITGKIFNWQKKGLWTQIFEFQSALSKQTVFSTLAYQGNS